MKRAHVRRLAMAAFAFLWLGVSPAPAEVKLRIYMQDGSLQAGNLITETDDTFVVLGKDGRVELQKKNIMFINGKTLKQWNERPDKLFQTEIMPSDVPDPKFVNNKAALPPPPVIEKRPVIPPVQKLPEAPPVVAAPAAPAVPMVLAPVEPPAPAAPPPAVEQVKPAAEPRAVTAKAERKSHRKPKAIPAAAPVAPVEASPVAERRPNSRRLADRAARGAAHRERGLALLAQGRRAKAIPELMIARLLEPNNGDTNLVLAQIYKAEGLTDAALRYLDHWTLRKSDVAAREVTEINRDIEYKARRLFHMQIAAVVGAFAWLPALLLYRRFRRRRRAAAPVEVAVDEEAVAEAPRAPDWVRQTEARFIEPVRPALVPPPALVKAPAAPPPSLKLTPPPAPEPVAPPFEIVREEEILAEEPSLPMEEFPAAPVEEPVTAEIPEPVYEQTPEDVPAPEPEPAYEPVVAGRDFDPHEILALARSVENSLMRANASATAGRIDESRRGYRTALALNPDCASAHLGLGYLAFCEQKWDTALLHYRKALSIDSSSADAHYGAARVLLEINRVDDAVPELRATLTLDPTYDDARDALTAIGKPA